MTIKYWTPERRGELSLKCEFERAKKFGELTIKPIDQLNKKRVEQNEIRKQITYS